MKEKKPIAYDVLKKDFIFVNGFVGLIVLITFVVMVLQHFELVPSMPCWLHDLFHIYCIGCGGTRAMFALLQGKIVESLYCNPAVVLGVLLVLHYEIGVLITLFRRNGRRYYCTNLVPIVLYVIIIVVFSIVRNYLLIGCGYDMLQDFIP